MPKVPKMPKIVEFCPFYIQVTRAHSAEVTTGVG
jgi:hypothetical protein